MIAISKFTLKYEDHVYMLLLPSPDSTQNEAASPITYIAKLGNTGNVGNIRR